jgi:apolipoprotein N-acyltransferase
MALSCPPIDLYFLGWIGLLPLFLALRTPRRGGFGEGFTAGLIFNIGILYWLAFNIGTELWIAIVTMVAAAFIIATGWGIGSWAFCRLRERLGGVAWIILPFGWTAWEGWLGHLGFLGELGFPWSLLALTQSRFDPLLQIMEFTGVWGVTFWTVAINVAVFHVWRGETKQIRRRAFVTFFALVAIPPLAIWHATSHYNKDAASIKVAVVQGNIPPLDKWTMGGGHSIMVYDSLTRLAVEQGVELAVWPETAIPVNLMHQSHYRERVSRLADESGVSIITGASDQVRSGGDAKPLNAAFLILPGKGPVERYAKKQLVPFGERVPFQSIAPSLGNLNFGQAEFLIGPRWTVFSMPRGDDTLRFPAVICFESAFPELVREFVVRGANFLVTLSNDSWYGWSSEPSQIAALSRFRSIETRRAMARASNSGESFICDQLGRVIAKTDLYKTTWAGAIVPLCEEETIYVKYGDWLLTIAFTVYGTALAFAAFKKRETGYE